MKRRIYTRRVLFGSTLILALLPAACKHKYDCTPDPINTTLAQGVTIKEGSYFKYTDSLTQDKDSFGVYRFNDNQLCDPDRQTKSHYLEYYMKNTAGTNVYVQTGSGVYGLFGAFKTTLFYYVPFKAGSVSAGATLADSLYSALSVAQYTSITINNQTFNDVYEVINKRIAADKSDTEYLHTFYSSESGLVKFRTKFKNEGWKVWELSGSHIIR